MRLIKKLFFAVFAIVVIAIAALYISGNEHILFGLRSTYLIGKNKPDIDDMAYFDLAVLPADKPEEWPMASAFNAKGLSAADESLHAQYQSTAFLVFKNDSLLFEKYFNDGGEKVKSNSFSMAKTFVAMMVGKAIEEGYIKGVDQKVVDFIPELKGPYAKELTIAHLLQMSSGIPFGESYGNPFGYMAKAYFGKDLIHETLKFEVSQRPGEGWIYEGGNTVLLGLLLHRATGRTCSAYFHHKFWSCIGAQDTAYWNLDHPGGMEKVFSGFYATAKDYARVGQLFNHDGIIGQDTILSPAFLKEMFTPCMNKDISPTSSNEDCFWYGYQLWMGTFEGEPFYSVRGLRGQYIITIPSRDIIIVRLGHEQSKERVEHMPVDMKEWIRMGVSLTS